MERRDFFKKMGLFAAMFGIGGKLKAQDAQPAEKKVAEPPKETDTKLTFLGTAHGAVTPTRFHSATLLQVGGKNYLIDAGDAACGQLTKNGMFLPDLNAIFITHPHLDHFGGLFMVMQ
ncbi:MAG: MBL fold metallo-hydrolase, partial [Victivallales bacterium]|nr:MBL fold metallo-hydrolase [Victivallales bacterium]